MKNYIIFFIAVFLFTTICYSKDREDIEILYPDAISKYQINCPSSNFTPYENFNILENPYSISPPSDYYSNILPYDITSIYICKGGQIYYAESDIFVHSGGALICEPNSIIIFGYHSGLYIFSGGFLSSRGTPEKMVQFLPSDPGIMGHWKGIFLYGGDEYSSPSEILYTYINGANKGISLNNISLNYPISYNIIENCYWGIFGYGPKQTIISNNAFYYCGDWVEVYGKWLGSAIELYHEPYDHIGDPAYIPETDSIIDVEGNTIINSVSGVTIHGSANELASGITLLIHNIYSKSYLYNVNLVDNYMSILSYNNGYYLYYELSLNKNWDFPEENEIIVLYPDTYPLEYSKGLQKYTLIKNSIFKDKGLMSIAKTPYIGMSTTVDGVSDSGSIDLGFHYYNPINTNNELSSDPNLLWADFDNSGSVDMVDFCIFSSAWMIKNIDPNKIPSCDLNKSPDYNHDGSVDIIDLCSFSQSWMAKRESSPKLNASITANTNDGSIEVLINNKDSSICQYFLMIDGVFVKPVVFFDYSPIVTVYLPWLSIGQHKGCVVGVWGEIIVKSDPITFEVQNRVGRCGLPSDYIQGSPLPFFVDNNSDKIKVNAYTYGSDLPLWSNTYNPGKACDFIPANVTQGDIDYIEFQKVSDSNSLIKYNVPITTNSTIVAVSSVFNSSQNDYRALIVLPDFKLNRVNSALIGYYKGMFENRKVPYKLFGSGSSSISNIKKYVSKYNIQYLIVNSHSNFIFPSTNIKITVIELDDGPVVSDKKSRVGSPAYLTLLPKGTEEVVRTWQEIGFRDLVYAQFDGCYTGRLTINSAGQLVEGEKGAIGLFSGPHSDLTEALGLVSDKSRFFFGWYGGFLAGSGSPYYQFSCNLSGTLQEGKTLYESILYAIQHCNDTQMNLDPKDDYRIKGQGFIDTMRIK
jgi:hypothetical protein